MAIRPGRFCAHTGCGNIVEDGRHCPVHAPIYAEEQARKAKEFDKRRLSSRQRGYSTRWDKFSKAFLSRPENQFCSLRMDTGCAVVAECVDHIDPPSSASDPRFWDKANHQPSCLHCNSVKGHRHIKGSASFGDGEAES